MEQQIKMAAKLYKCRDTAKKFYAEKYHETLADYKKIIKDVMILKGIEEIPALLLISKSKTYNSSGMAQMLFMAAVVELIEPS